MKNNLEEKGKFFAQYWGQEVKKYPKSVNINSFKVNGLCGRDDYLELTPLSQISDEDAIACLHILFENKDIKCTDIVEYGKNWAKTVFNQPLNVIYLRDYMDMMYYLRSKGYALPWMGISVEKQIKLGWIKLKNNE